MRHAPLIRRTPQLTIVNHNASRTRRAKTTRAALLLRGLLHPGRIARGAGVDAIEALVGEAAAFAPAGDPDQDELSIGALGEQRTAIVAGAGVALGLGPA